MPRRARAEGEDYQRSVRARETTPGPHLVSQGTKRKRMPWWPLGVDSELEMKLYTRLQHAGLPLGVGQHRFVPGRQYRFDRCWIEQMVAAEVQGGIWTGGRHARGSGIAAECVKLSIAAALGWRVLPLAAEMIEDGTAVDLIRQALEIAPHAAAGDGEVGSAILEAGNGLFGVLRRVRFYASDDAEDGPTGSDAAQALIAWDRATGAKGEGMSDG